MLLSAISSPTRRCAASHGRRTARRHAVAAVLSRFDTSSPLSTFHNSDDDDDREGRRSRYDLSLPPEAYATRALVGVASSSSSSPSSSLRQTRLLSTSACGPSRCSTTVAHPPVHGGGSSFSSKAPPSDRDGDDGADGGGGGGDTGGDGSGSGSHPSRIEQGRAAAARGARAGARVARRSAVSVRDLMKKYGWTFVGTYFTIYWGTVALIFAGIDSGLIDPATIAGYIQGSGFGLADGADAGAEAAKDAKSTVNLIAGFLEEYEWTRPYAESVRSNPRTANFGLAWFATKFTEPVRLGASLVLVPRVHRALGKAPPPEEGEEEEQQHDEGTETKREDAEKKQ